jgi:hypothetical protein
MEAVTAADRLRGVCLLLVLPTAVFGIAQLATLVKLSIDLSAFSGHSWIEMLWRWGWAAHLMWIALILASIGGALLAFLPRPRFGRIVIAVALALVAAASVESIRDFGLSERVAFDPFSGRPVASGLLCGALALASIGVRANGHRAGHATPVLG